MGHIAHLSCIVPAAGSGRRYGSTTPKQYLTVAGRPVLAHALERLMAAFARSGLRDSLHLIVVVNPGHDLPDDCIDASLRASVISGGQTRQDSVRLALEHLSAHPPARAPSDPAGHWVLIHDGDRPCVDPEDITRLFELSRGYDGGFLCYPLTDSLIELSSAVEVSGTSAAAFEGGSRPRDRYRLVATPQLFIEGAIQRAHRLAAERELSGYDDATLAMRAGQRLVAVDSSPQNLKLTFAGDLASAEHILSAHTGRGQRDAV